MPGRLGVVESVDAQPPRGGICLLASGEEPMHDIDFDIQPRRCVVVFKPPCLLIERWSVWFGLVWNCCSISPMRNGARGRHRQRAGAQRTTAAGLPAGA